MRGFTNSFYLYFERLILTKDETEEGKKNMPSSPQAVEMAGVQKAGGPSRNNRWKKKRTFNSQVFN
jgi:hypothetical protein